LTTRPPGLLGLHVAENGSKAVDVSASDEEMISELSAWFDEVRRLVEEAERRFSKGDFLPAMASLIAIPPIHRLLVERCAGHLEREDDASDDQVDSDCAVGLYL
jgi:hypothetical protein